MSWTIFSVFLLFCPVKNIFGYRRAGNLQVASKPETPGGGLQVCITSISHSTTK
jgi:hypothetical protein